MDETAHDAAIQRLARLEQESRCWKVLGVGAMALLGLIVLLGASGTKPAKAANEIQAKRFVIVDKDGNKRGQLGVGGMALRG